jgi:hypothetical protein
VKLRYVFFISNIHMAEICTVQYCGGRGALPTTSQKINIISLASQCIQVPIRLMTYDHIPPLATILGTNGKEHKIHLTTHPVSSITPGEKLELYRLLGK